MSEWFGDDGQKYDSWDKWVGANNRYRQQKEQTEAINKLLKYKEDEKEEQKYQENLKKDKEKKEEIEDNINEFKDLFNNYLYFEKAKNFNELEIVVKNLLSEIEKDLKSDIDSMVKVKKEYLKYEDICKGYKKNDTSLSAIFNRTVRDNSCLAYQDEEYILVKKIVYFRNFNIQRKNFNINFCDNLYKDIYNRIILYLKSKFRELNLAFDFKIDNQDGFILLNENFKRKARYLNGDTVKESIETNKHVNNYILEKNKSDTNNILENLNLEKGKIEELKKIQESQITEINKKIIELKNEIKDSNEKITKLKDIIEIEDVNKIKEIVLDIDYEFSKSIIGKMYSDNEIRLLLKMHIKDLELNIDTIKNKIIFYEIREYLLSNTTSISISKYEEFYSKIDYKEEYNNILNYEKEQKRIKEEENKKQALQTERENLIKVLKKVEKQKRKNEQPEQNNQEKILNKIENSKEQPKEQKHKKNTHKKFTIKKAIFLIFIIVIVILYFIGSKNENVVNNENLNNYSDIIKEQTLPSYVIKSENYMTFNISISEFVKKFNEVSESNAKSLQDSDFKYIGDIPYENSITLKAYLYNPTNSKSIIEYDKGIVLQVAPNEKIASIRYLSTNDIYSNDIILKRIIDIVINKDVYSAEKMIKNSKDNFENPIRMEDLHFGYEYWKIDELLAFELFAV